MGKIRCAHTDVLPIQELKNKFHPLNPNQHTDEQIERLSQILEYQGARKPATISKRSDLLTAGHGRVLAAEKAGWTHYPVDYQDYDDEASEYADLVADNALSEWSELNKAGINDHLQTLGPDFDIDMLGIKDFTLDIAEKLEPGIEDDEVPEVKDTRCKPGDIWQLGRHRLMCGDSLNIDNVDQLLSGEEVDLLFTDPPYGISVVNVGASAKVGFVGAQNAPGPLARARAYKPIIGDDQDFDPSALFAIACNTRILWGANCYASKLPDNPQWLVWDKKTQDGGLDHNNFSDCELAWTDAKGKSVKVYRHVWAGMLRHGSRKEEMSERVHPTQKPVGLCEQILNDFATGTVLDLFGGSGSTLIACEKTNRKCFMMELDAHYCDVILTRFEKYTGKTAERLNA